jgi:hypothetical protein
MQYLNSDGTLNALKVASTLKALAKNVNDSIYYCFDDLTNEKRLLAIEAHNNILTLANELERQEDEFFNET